MEELQQLLAAMGCSTPTEALASVARTNTALASIQAATGRANANEALASAQELVGFARQVETALGTSGREALAKLEGLKSAQARVAELEQRAQAAEKATADREAVQAMDQASTEGRLPPAERAKAEGVYTQFGLGGLKTFLSMLPQVGPRNSVQQPGQRQPAPRAGADEVELTADELAVAKAMGKTPAEALEAKKLWAKGNGVMSHAELTELNAKSALKSPV